MADDTWYGQLARWIIGGVFWTGIAIGGMGVFGIYKYKRRLQEKAKEEILKKYKQTMLENVLLNEVVHGAKVETASLSKSEHPWITDKAAEVVCQSMTTRKVESLNQGLFPFETRTILPSSSSIHSDDSEATLIQEDDDNLIPDILDNSRNSQLLDEVFQASEESETRQEVRPENSNLSGHSDVTKSSPDIVRELAEAAEDCDTSTLQTKPAHLVYQS